MRMIHQYVRGGIAAKLIHGKVFASGAPLTVPEIKFVVCGRRQISAPGLGCYSAIKIRQRLRCLKAQRQFTGVRRLQKIAESGEALVISGASTQIRITCQKSGRRIPSTTKRGRQGEFVRGDPQNVASQSQREAWSHDRGKRKAG